MCLLATGIGKDWFEGLGMQVGRQRESQLWYGRGFGGQHWTLEPRAEGPSMRPGSECRRGLCGLYAVNGGWGLDLLGRRLIAGRVERMQGQCGVTQADGSSCYCFLFLAKLLLLYYSGLSWPWQLNPPIAYEQTDDTRLSCSLLTYSIVIGRYKDICEL